MITRQQSWTRYQIKNDNSPAKLDLLPDFVQGFKPACEVKIGIFDPRTIFYRPGIPRSSLITRASRSLPARSAASEAVIPRAMLACTRRGRVSRPSIRLSEACFERGFRPACEVKIGTFDPRTTFGRPGISRSSLNRTFLVCRIIFGISFFCVFLRFFSAGFL